MTLATILAGLKAAIPGLIQDVNTVATVAGEIKTAATAAGEWTAAHETEIQALVPAGTALPQPVAAPQAAS